MSMFTMIVWIVTIACVTSLLAKRYEYKRSAGEREALEGELEERLERLEALEERVRVLEAIVTDSKYELRRKLEELERAG